MRVVKRFPINQGAAGNTVVEAGVAGNKHKVIGFFCTLGGNGTLTWFSDGVALTGPIELQDNQNPPIVIPPNLDVFILETNAGESLNFTTTGGSLKGVLLYLTEP
jgi:hypothetical protein